MRINHFYLTTIMAACLTLTACNQDKSDKSASLNQSTPPAQVQTVTPTVASAVSDNASSNSNANTNSDTNTHDVASAPVVSSAASSTLPPGVSITSKGSQTIVRFKSSDNHSNSKDYSDVSVTVNSGTIINNNTSDGTQVNHVQMVNGNHNSVVNTNSGSGTQMNIIQQSRGNNNQNQVIIEGDDDNKGNAGGEADINDKHIHTTGSIDSVVQDNGVTTITITGDKHPVITQLH